MNTISTEFRLTGFGKTFTSGGALRGYGYVRGGMTGYLPGTKAKQSPALDSLRAAVASGSSNASSRNRAHTLALYLGCAATSFGQACGGGSPAVRPDR